MNESVLDHALRLAEMGYLIFPCVPDGKAPMGSLVPNGFKDATTDPEKIREWWHREPNANLAIPTNGLLVVDVDGAENKWPNDADKELELAMAPMAVTPRGGRHYVFAQPLGETYRNTTSKIAPNVDSRADGGYILVAPSVVDGKTYRWLSALEERSQLPMPPEWIAGPLRATTTVPPGAAPPSEHPSPTDGTFPEGMRNSSMTSVAGRLRRAGHREDEISAMMHMVNQNRCVPPLSEKEVDRIVKSVSRYHPDMVSQAIMEGHYYHQFGGGDDGARESIDDPGPIPEELLRAPGFISEVMDLTLKSAPYPNIPMAFAGAVSLQSLLGARRVCDPGDNRTNIYLLGLAYSGVGKDWPRKVNSAVLFESSGGEMIADQFASGEGIQDALFLEPAMIFQTDEIDGVLMSFNLGRDARYENILNTMLTMYGSANTRFKMRRRADDERARYINQPSMTLFGTAIPEHFFSALSERLFTKGLPSRMIIIEAGIRGAAQEPKRIVVPDRIKDTVKWWLEFKPGKGNLDDWNPTCAVVPITPDGMKMLHSFRDEADLSCGQCQAKGDNAGSSVWSRAAENTRKLALIYAISENHQSPEIGTDAISWAAQIVSHHIKRMLYMASIHMADSPFEAEGMKIIKKLEGASGNRLQHSVLLKRCKVDSKRFKDVIQTMRERGDVVMEEETTSGRPKIFYRLVKKEG